MASIAGLYSFGGRGRGDDSHGHDRDHNDRGQGFCARGGFFKKGRLACSATGASQQSGWFDVFRGENSGETHITGITGITGLSGTSELLDGEDLLTLGDKEQ